MTGNFKHDCVFLPGARRAYDELAREEREQVDRLVELLCTDPRVDGVRTFDFPVPPAIFRLFHNGKWAVIYNVTAPFVIQIWTIARSEPGRRPRLRR